MRPITGARLLGLKNATTAVIPWTMKKTMAVLAALAACFTSQIAAAQAERATI